MNILRQFGSAVRKLREQAGLSQEGLADRAGLDRTYVSGVERGVRNPTLKVIYKLTRALGSDLQRIFSMVQHQTSPSDEDKR